MINQKNMHAFNQNSIKKQQLKIFVNALNPFKKTAFTNSKDVPSGELVKAVFFYPRMGHRQSFRIQNFY